MTDIDKTGYSHTSKKLTREMEVVLDRAPRPAAYEKLMDEARKRIEMENRFLEKRGVVRADPWPGRRASASRA